MGNRPLRPRSTTELRVHLLRRTISDHVQRCPCQAAAAALLLPWYGQPSSGRAWTLSWAETKRPDAEGTVVVLDSGDRMRYRHDVYLVEPVDVPPYDLDGALRAATERWLVTFPATGYTLRLQTYLDDIERLQEWGAAAYERLVPLTVRQTLQRRVMRSGFLHPEDGAAVYYDCLCPAPTDGGPLQPRQVVATQWLAALDDLRELRVHVPPLDSRRKPAVMWLTVLVERLLGLPSVDAPPGNLVCTVHDHLRTVTAALGHDWDILGVRWAAMLETLGRSEATKAILPSPYPPFRAERDAPPLAPWLQEVLRRLRNAAPGREVWCLADDSLRRLARQAVPCDRARRWAQGTPWHRIVQAIVAIASESPPPPCRSVRASVDQSLQRLADLLGMATRSPVDGRPLWPHEC